MNISDLSDHFIIPKSSPQFAWNYFNQCTCATSTSGYCSFHQLKQTQIYPHQETKDRIIEALQINLLQLQEKYNSLYTDFNLLEKRVSILEYSPPSGPEFKKIEAEEWGNKIP